MPDIDTFEFWINVYALLLSFVSVVVSTKKLLQLWRTRHLRKVWGLKDGDAVTVVCSELDDPEDRQHVEPREFIYNLKYGDVDAYFEVVVTLLRLYPKIRLRVMSAGEVQNARVNLAGHLILIGGPDYNSMVDQVLDSNVTQFTYRSPEDIACRSEHYPDEIVIFDKLSNREYCSQVATRDFGYFERIVNPHNPDNYIVLIGGCHTIGVTGAVKAFSMLESEYGETPRGVFRNAALVARKIRKAKTFSVLVSVEQMGQTIAAPVVREENIIVGADQSA